MDKSTTQTFTDPGPIDFNVAWSLRGKLTWAFIFISLLMVLSISVVVYVSGRSLLEQEAFDGIEALRDSRADIVRTWFLDQRRDMQVLARNPSVMLSMTTFKNAVDTSTNYGNTLSERMENLRDVYTGDGDDAGTDTSTYASAHQRYHDFYREIRRSYRYSDVYLLSPTGDVIYSVSKQPDFMTTVEDPSPLAAVFREVVEAETPAYLGITDFVLYEPLERVVMLLAAPVFQPVSDGRVGRLLGVIVVAVPTETLNQILRQDDDAGGETYLVGEDGLFRTDSRFLDHPDEERVILNESLRVTTEAVQAALSGNRGSGVVSGYQLNEVVSAWQPLRLRADNIVLNWALIAEKSEDEVTGPVNDLLIRVIMVAIVAIFLGSGLSLLVAGQVTGPVTDLTRAAQLIAGGDLTQQVQVHTKDEIGLLAVTFNRMAARLHHTVDDLESSMVRLQTEQAARQEAENEQLRLQQEIIDAQKDALRELSTPVVPVMDRVLVMPLVGEIEASRARDIMRALLRGIGQYRAKVVILDITGVEMIDTQAAQALLRSVQAARLKGAITILTGVTDAVAETLVDLGISWKQMHVCATLQDGLHRAMTHMAAFHNESEESISEE